MSNVFTEMADGLDNFANSYEMLTEGYFTAHGDDYIVANREQMLMGLRPDNTQINPYYKQESRYWQMKQRMPHTNPSKPALVPDLRYTGGFYGGMEVKVADGTIEMTSTDPEYPFLQAIYGNVLGIPDDYMEQTVKPNLTEWLKDTIRTMMMS